MKKLYSEKYQFFLRRFKDLKKRFENLMKYLVLSDYLRRKNVSPLMVARFFSWVSLLFIIVFSIFLSVFMGTNIRNSLITSQESYSLLLADNMNKQIFRRFTLPVAYASGRVALSEPAQYQLLNEVVESLMHGLGIETIRVFDANLIVAYSTIKEDVRRKDLSTIGVEQVFSSEMHHFEIIASMSFIRALFMPSLPPNSFVLRTVYPLTVDLELAPFKDAEGKPAPILGALEILQDVTGVYKNAIRSQWAILLGFGASTLVLFILLQIIAKMAQRTIRDHMEQDKKHQAELYQNEKLASTGRMVASIAHEIRNPLGIIRSSAEYLLQRKKNNDMDSSLEQAIFDESCRLSTTVEEFLNYARPRGPSTDIVDVVDVIHMVHDFLQSTFQIKDIVVCFNLLPSMRILGDKDVLYRAVYNIFINAEQSMGEQGIFWISSERDLEEYVISFVDSGFGFATDSMEQALDPFFTTKDTGTGLGLPIVQSIIHSHNGTLHLYNHEQGGAVVELRFPSLPHLRR